MLVNNAGFEVWGPLEEMTVEDLKDQFETNVYGPFRLITAVLPCMRQRGNGVIVNVSSVAGRVGAPLNGLYSASKFALEALSETLHYEAGHFGVRCHLVEPGGVATPFPDNRRLVGAAAGDEGSPYRELITQWEAAVRAPDRRGPRSAGGRGRCHPGSDRNRRQAPLSRRARRESRLHRAQGHGRRPVRSSDAPTARTHLVI